MTWDDLLGYKIMGFPLSKIFSALLILIGCRVLMSALMRPLDRMIDKLRTEKTLKSFIKSIIRVLLWFVVILVVADALGVPIASVLAVFGVLSIAVSLSLQNALGNLVSGVTLLITRPFTVDDYIEIGPIAGQVFSLTMTYTKLITPENKTVLVPNSQVTAAQIINYTMQENRRVELIVSASYDCPTEKALCALEQAALKTPLVLADPAPFAGISDFGASGIAYVVRVFSKSADYQAVYFGLRAAVKAAFDQNGIEMPYNQMVVHLEKPENQA